MEKVYVKMIGLYGLPNRNAYFRKQGSGCFDFVNDKKYASALTVPEAVKITLAADWYCKGYNAEKMILEWIETE
jgi:hypothetical protein